MVRVGLTGGIGSGKTTVCRIFESLDIPVYYSDIEAKNLMYHFSELKVQIKSFLGDSAYHSNGRPNRQYIASKVFTNKNLLKKLNGIVHPALITETVKWFDRQTGPYAINEAAILLEAKFHLHMDKVIVVTAPVDVRVERVVKRDKSSTKQVVARSKNQMKEEERLTYADYVVDNSGKKNLIEQVVGIHRKLMER